MVVLHQEKSKEEEKADQGVDQKDPKADQRVDQLHIKKKKKSNPSCSYMDTCKDRALVWLR